MTRRPLTVSSIDRLLACSPADATATLAPPPIAALERATQTSLLRFHLQHSRQEQESYLEAVETARVHTAMEAKAEGRREAKKAKLGDGAEAGAAAEAAKPGKKARERTYRQREVVDAGKRKGIDGGKALEGVLSSLF